MDRYKENIINLKHGERWVWPESDYGKAEIWNLHNVYILFEIPMYGGELRYCEAYPKNRVDQLINDINTWT